MRKTHSKSYKFKVVIAISGGMTLWRRLYLSMMWRESWVTDGRCRFWCKVRRTIEKLYAKIGKLMFECDFLESTLLKGRQGKRMWMIGHYTWGGVRSTSCLR